MGIGNCRSCGDNLPHHELGIRTWTKLHKCPYITCSICDRTRRHNFTPGWFKDKAIEQDHRCYICGIYELHIDHDHSTGEARGLLCRWCNAGLGHFKDKPHLMIRAIKYLEKYNG